MMMPPKNLVRSGIKFLVLGCFAVLWGWFFSSSKPLVSFANYGIAFVAFGVGINDIVKAINNKSGSDTHQT